MEEEEQVEQPRESAADIAAQRRAKRNQNADRTTQALDNVANVAQFTPAAGIAKGYQTFRKVDNALGGHVSRGLSKAVNVAPGAKIASRIGSSGLANNTVGLMNAKNNMANGVKKSTTDATSVSHNGKKKSDNSDKSSKDKKEGISKPSSLQPKNDDKKSKGKAEQDAMGTLFGEMNMFKFIIILAVATVATLTFFIVVLISSVDVTTTKGKIATAMAMSNISSKASSSSKASTKVGNVTKKEDTNNSYKRSDYDFSEYDVEYTEPADGVESDTRDNNSRGKFLSSIRNEYPKEVYTSYYNMGNNFRSSKGTCYGDECDSEAETQFYQKVSDISFRYRKLYNVELDWTLISAVVLVDDNDFEKIFKANISEYKTSEVNNLKKVMSLDWEYDYENISDYEYLSPSDARYDLQILAKNMVTKTTTQTCVDANGKVLESKELIDVEDVLIDKKLTNGNYLNCKKGTYKVSSTYKLDKNKFDEFLNEYLEKRHFLPKGSSNSSGSPSSGGGAGYVASSGEYGWPLPQGASSCRSSCFGPRIHPITGKFQNHSGDDYPAASGTPVYAIESGTVVQIATDCKAKSTSCSGGAMGNHVVIDHGNGIKSIYMHASKVDVTVGQQVTKGQKIMEVGTTGSSTGNHLHITIKENGVNVAPSNYIGALPACPNSCLGV